MNTQDGQWLPGFDTLSGWWESLPDDLRADLLALGDSEPSDELVACVRESGREPNWAAWIDEPNSKIEFLPQTLLDFVEKQREQD